MGDLVPLKDLATMLPSKHTDEDFAAVSSGGGYISRVQLMTSQAAKCKDGSFPINHYALVSGQDFQDLGAEVDCAVVSWRPKAIRFGDVPITSHTPSDQTFKDIKDDSETRDSGCMYGPEFLLWIPSVKKFVTFFCGSKSSRREAPSIHGRIGEGVTLGSRKVETSQYTWFAPQGRALTVLSGEGPAADDLQEMLEKFNNPKESNVKLAESEDGERVR